ncbi:MAG: glycoside hydrolase family 88 protein [Bacteroidota bacterium]|nr:glycoside hydrolase family 88 protein [Bacteroidota bacterium]
MKFYSLLLASSLLLTHGTSFAAKPQKKNASWPVQMAESQMKRCPEPRMLEGGQITKWGYTQGLFCKSLMELTNYTGNKKFYNYAKIFADSLVNEDGSIKTYKANEYNIDQVNSGKILFQLYRDTKQEKYAKAIRLLRDQMRTHPRTSEGGFWHKKTYPNQMWLDGLYMGSPFLAQYAKEFNEPALFDDVVNQFVLIDKHLYDPKTGLYYHGWDESRQQKWADKTTGLSPNFWGRSIGWYGMALVDALDFIPQNHPGRTKMIEIIKKVASGGEKYQDAKTGLWYQVVDQGTRKGNYLESSASSMFVYFYFKAVRMGFLDKKYLTVAHKGYNGILNNLIKKNNDGTISITNCCSVAGLGGTPRRDGSFEYYISEKVIDNDLKTVGPFIMAGIEMEKLTKK